MKDGAVIVVPHGNGGSANNPPYVTITFPTHPKE